VSTIAAKLACEVIAKFRQRLVAIAGEGVCSGHGSAALAFGSGVPEGMPDEVGWVIGHAHCASPREVADSRMLSMMLVSAPAEREDMWP
jgi:hypothetical protein